MRKEEEREEEGSERNGKKTKGLEKIEGSESLGFFCCVGSNQYSPYSEGGDDDAK